MWFQQRGLWEMQCWKNHKKTPPSKHIIISTVDTGNKALAKLCSQVTSQAVKIDQGINFSEPEESARCL